MSFRSRAARQEGFTIIEVMIAALVILLAMGVVITSAVGFRDLSSTDETKAAATKVAQQELERLRALGWEALEMDGTPAASGSATTNPLSSVYLSGTNYRPATDAAWQPLAIGTAPDVGDIDTRSVSAAVSTWSSDKISGNLYRFVTYGDDTTCTACSGTQDYKRITVAVTVTAPSRAAITAPLILSTQVANPADTVVTTATSAGAPPAVTNYLTYYPYDTQGIYATRQNQTASHSKHSTKDKPDLMDADPPPDPNVDPNNPTIPVPTYNYATDVSDAATFGRGIKKDSLCDKYDDDNKVMFWVSPILTSNVKITGNAVADVYAQTLDGLSHPGRFCVSIWDVPGTLQSDGKVNGTELLVGTMQSAELNPIYTAYDEIQFNFRFLAVGATYYTMTTGRRIGIKLTVSDKLANNTTASNDLTFMYDHPDYPSSFGLETTP